MIDFRLYRIAFLPALAAFVLMMFSLEGVPETPDPQVAPASFDAERADDNLKEILAAGPSRTPGSEGDAAVADLVAERFQGVEAGTTSVQVFGLEVDGTERELQNVILTIPGDSEDVILVMAARDARTGPGAASSAAATAALIELAEALGGAEHAKTFVLVSTDGATEGAAGARQFIDTFEDRDAIEAALVLNQPAARDTEDPYVLRHSTSDAGTSVGLVATTEAILEEQSGRESSGHGLLADLSRLAFPNATGEQAVLISEGVDAVALSSAGEEPLSPADDERADPEVLGEFGSAALGTLLVLDPLAQPLPDGPDTYVEFAGSLIPGWAIAVFALSLLLPAAVAALDAVARAARRRAGIVKALGWAFALALPLIVLVALIRLLGLAGVIADPRYPFDPGRFELGVGEVALLVVLLAGLLVGYLVTGLGRLPSHPRREALAPALGAAAVTGAVVLWVFNPYLALLLAPAAHAWILADGGGPRLARAALVVASALPALLALRVATAAVGAGPWDVVLLAVDGQLPLIELLALSPLAGSLGGSIVVLWHPGQERTDDRGRRPDSAAPIGGRPQPEWGADDGIPESGSMDPNARPADEWVGTQPGKDPRPT